METREEKLKALQKSLDKLENLDNTYGNKTIFLNNAEQKKTEVQSGRFPLVEDIFYNEDEVLEIFYISKKDFKNIAVIYHTELANHLFDSLELEYLTYTTRSYKEIMILKNNKGVNYTKSCKELVKISSIIEEILQIEHVSNHNRIKFLEYKDHLMTYVLSINDLNLKVNIIKGLIKYFTEEVEKGKNHLRIKLRDFERLLLGLSPLKESNHKVKSPINDLIILS